MKDKILDAFAELGFILEEVDYGYSFNYEATCMLWMVNEDDPSFFSMAVPVIAKIDGGNKEIMHDVMNKVNLTLKYVKCHTMGDNIWLFYEREIIGDEDLPLVISRMVIHLDNAKNFAHKSILEALETDTDTDDEAVVDVEDVVEADADVDTDEE